MNGKDINKSTIISDYEVTRHQMLEQGYKENLGTITILKANISAFVSAVPIVMAFLLLYNLTWGKIDFIFNMATVYILFMYFMNSYMVLFGVVFARRAGKAFILV